MPKRPRSKSSRARHSREKGKVGEQEVVRLLRPIYPECRSKRAGGESASVDRGRDILGTPGMCVQSKKEARPRPIAALSEACAAMGGDEIPVAFVREAWTGIKSSPRSARGRWCVVMLAEDFVGLYRMAHVSTLELAEIARDQAEARARVAVSAALHRKEKVG